MACFIAPLVQALATSALRKARAGAVADPSSGPLLRALPALEKMLWGGTLMLIVDHAISGEIMLRFPFFSALEKQGGGAVMLREILSVGVPMCVVITLVWALWALLRDRQPKTQTTN